MNIRLLLQVTIFSLSIYCCSDTTHPFYIYKSQLNYCNVLKYQVIFWNVNITWQCICFNIGGNKCLAAPRGSTFTCNAQTTKTHFLWMPIILFRWHASCHYQREAVSCTIFVVDFFPLAMFIVMVEIRIQLFTNHCRWIIFIFFPLFTCRKY